MSKDTLDVTDDQKRFCIWLLDTWDSKGLDTFPYTFGFIAKSLNDMTRAGMPLHVIQESMVLSMNREQVPSHEKWTYGCGIAWKKFKAERPLRDLVEEWKESVENQNQP